MNQRQGEGGYAPAFAQSRERLARLAPQEIAQRSLSSFDENKSCFYINSLGRKWQVSYPAGELSCADSGQTPPLDWGLILLNYLSSARDIPLTGQWVSYRELPQGNVFFAHIRTHTLEALARFFDGWDLETLRQKLVVKGFEPVDYKADLAMQIYFAPRVPVLVQFWAGDDEVPSACQILFDSSAADQMHIEDIAALCGVVRDIIIKNSPD